jgi:hypothetical protein
MRLPHVAPSILPIRTPGGGIPITRSSGRGHSASTSRQATCSATRASPWMSSQSSWAATRLARHGWYETATAFLWFGSARPTTRSRTRKKLRPENSIRTQPNTGAIGEISRDQLSPMEGWMKQDIDTALARLTEAFPQNIRTGKISAALAVEGWNSRRDSGALPGR